MSAPRDQQVESTETSGTQETPRLHNLGLKAALCVAFFSVVSAVILFAVLSNPPPLEPRGCGMGSPSVDLSATQTSRGYEFEITATSRTVPSECYKVAILQDGTPIWLQYTTWKNVTEGNIMTGPAGEYLNFTDSDHNGKLSRGDFFTLERLEPSTEYELILLWAVNVNKITSEVINVP